MNVWYYSDKLTTAAVAYLGSMMFMTTYRMIGEGVNTCLICGCFRGGGDTKYGLYMDMIMMWFVAVPLMALAAYVIKLPPVWVYFVMTMDELEKMPFVISHFRKYQWMKNEKYIIDDCQRILSSWWINSDFYSDS